MVSQSKLWLTIFHYYYCIFLSISYYRYCPIWYKLKGTTKVNFSTHFSEPENVLHMNWPPRGKHTLKPRDRWLVVEFGEVPGYFVEVQIHQCVWCSWKLGINPLKQKRYTHFKTYFIFRNLHKHLNFLGHPLIFGISWIPTWMDFTVVNCIYCWLCRS